MKIAIPTTESIKYQLRFQTFETARLSMSNRYTMIHTLHIVFLRYFLQPFLATWPLDYMLEPEATYGSAVVPEAVGSLAQKAKVLPRQNLDLPKPRDIQAPLEEGGL